MVRLGSWRLGVCHGKGLGFRAEASYLQALNGYGYNWWILHVLHLL